MKLINYFIFLSIFAYCNFSYATPKEKLSNLACPYILPAEKDFPAGWEFLGKIPTDKLRLRATGINYGNAAEEKIRLSKDRIFAEETIEEWEHINNTYQAVTEYAENHNENSLICTYSRTFKESFDANLNVVLLIPLPKDKALNCLFIKRHVEPEVEASCKVK